jgi:hypothetical protein
MPVSKPLMQQNMMEAFDRVAPFAVKGLTTYDPEKLVDELIIRPADLNPEDLKVQEEAEDSNVGDNRLGISIELASQENQMVTNGEPIPPMGTPYAAEPHTRVHLEYMKSESGKQMDEAKFKLLSQHVMGEVMAIQQREKAGGSNVQVPGGGVQGTQDLTKETVMPGTIEGGGQVPTGRALGNG